MSARWYSPGTGSFTSNDTVTGAPLPATADGNPYGYAAGNPLTTADPTGHYLCDLGIAIADCPAQLPPISVGQGQCNSSQCGSQNSTSIAAQWQEQQEQQSQQEAQAAEQEQQDLLAAQQALNQNQFPQYPYPYPYPSIDLLSRGSCASYCSLPPSQYILPWYPPPPPPPPPPPQDKFTGPDPAAAPPVPSWLRNDPFITHIIHDTTNPAGLFHHGIHINEPNQLPNSHVSGTSPNDNPLVGQEIQLSINPTIKTPPDKPLITPKTPLDGPLVFPKLPLDGPLITPKLPLDGPLITPKPEDANGGVNVSAVTDFPDKAAARQALDGDAKAAANRFFRDATSKSINFQVEDLGDSRYQLRFFSPANNPGYGKLYVQEIDSEGNVLTEYKDTFGPDGLIQRKWLTGGP